MSPIDRAIGAVLKPVEGAHENEDEYGMPYITHQGVLELIPGLRFKVYQLSTGERVLDKESMAAFLACLSGPEA